MNQFKQHLKVLVTGAAGQIGYALLPRLASGAIFGSEVSLSLHLLELEVSLPALQGVVMELQDCAFSCVRNIVYTSDLKTAMDGINLALMVGSAPRKQGMERADLLQMNGGIFSVQGKAINDYAAQDVRVVVVGNPCNTNCLIAMNHAKDIPNDRFFAMTRLDENRAKYQLAAKTNLPVAKIKKMAIWGNHSATQYPDFYHALCDNRPAIELITDLNWLQNGFISTVQQRGAEIIKARGASSAASAANAALETAKQVLTDTPSDDWFSVARCSQGEYGIPEGLIFSFPCQTSNEQVNVIGGLRHNDFSLEKIGRTTAELQDELHTVESLGLI